MMAEEIVLFCGAAVAVVLRARAALPVRTRIVVLLDDDARAELVAAVLTAGADVCVRGGMPAILASTWSPAGAGSSPTGGTTCRTPCAPPDLRHRPNDWRRAGGITALVSADEAGAAVRAGANGEPSGRHTVPAAGTWPVSR